MTRDEHLAWAKKRALEYVEQGAVADGIASFMSDAQKDMGSGLIVDVTKPASGMLFQLGLMHAMSGNRVEARRWIEGWN